MQTPSGVAIHDGRLTVVSWRDVIVNPSWLYRLPHMVAAAYLTASFLVAGVGAWYLLKGEHLPFARRTVALGTAFATVLIAGQVFIGDLVYGTMLRHQPSKMQAAEGFWEKKSQSPAPYYWIIVPDQANQRNRLAVGIPYLGSVWLTHSLRGRVEGLQNTPRDRQPRMGMVFYAFRIMYGLAIVMFAIGVASLWLRLSGKLFSSRRFLWVLVLMTPSGVIATLAGWYVGDRTPAVGHLRNSESGRRNIARSGYHITVQLGWIHLYLCCFHHCVSDIYNSTYQTWSSWCPAACRGVGLPEERLSAARFGQANTNNDWS